MLTIDLPKELDSAFATIALEQNTTKELLAKEAVMRLIEDFKDAQIGEKAYKEYLESGKEGVAWQDFKKEIDL